MNFSDLVEEVKTITARPDLQSKAESAVSAATLKAHNSGFYYNDLVELPRRLSGGIEWHQRCPCRCYAMGH